MNQMSNFSFNAAATLFLLLLTAVEITVSFRHTDEIRTPEIPDTSYTYSRTSDIEKHCGILVPSAVEQPPDDNRAERMKKELSFKNGDWYHAPPGAPPLMPFDDREPQMSYFGDGPPLKLASFWLTDVDPTRRVNFKNTVSVSGIMRIGIFRAYTADYKPHIWSPDFHLQRGISTLIILFEGVYFESEEYRQMCLLGTTKNPWTSSEEIDDQILLVLRFPKTFSLTSRFVNGEMKSLSKKWNEVQISSQLSRGYEFGSNTCSPHPYPDSVIKNGVEVFKGDRYCEMLDRYVWNEVFEFESTRKDLAESNGDITIGPFSFVVGDVVDASYNSSDKLRLMFQELHCVPGTDQNGVANAMVSFVLRVVLKSAYLTREELRTGFSTGTTLAAEGRWDASDGQLCMVGCTSTVPQRCDSRITLYFPRTISLTQTSIVLGAISSTLESHSPIRFQRITDRMEFVRGSYWGGNLKWSYNYSKIAKAKEFQMRNQPPDLGRRLSKSGFWYPSSKGENMGNFSSLADVLSVQVCVAPQTEDDREAPKTCVELLVLSVGSLFGRFFSRLGAEEEKSFHSISEEIEISGRLVVKGEQFCNVSLLFEGIYDPAVGRMHLIGCRDVEELIGNGSGSSLEEGRLDCLIEIQVRFSPENARWLLNPKIRLSINSQRDEEDPFYFPPLSTNTFLITYEKKFQDVKIRKGFEDDLRVILLAVAIVCISRQLHYTEKEGHSSAHISVVMLGIPVLDFAVPLITGGEVFPKWQDFASHISSGNSDDIQLFLQPLDFLFKLMLLIAILESVKLLQKVWKSRKALRMQVKQLSYRIPSDKLVFPVFVMVHLAGFSALLLVHKTRGVPLWSDLESYGDMVQDFFLLPQIIGNAFWGARGQPLRKTYYIGFTMIRLVLQVYDCVRDPLPNLNYSAIEFQYLSMESYYNQGNITVSAIIITLALIVYFQQRVGCASWKFGDGGNLESKPGFLYERLVSE